MDCRQLFDHGKIILANTSMVVELTMSGQHSDKSCSDAVLCTVHLYPLTTSWRRTILSATPVFTGPPIQGYQKMDPEQLSSYLRLLDLPLQLDTSPHPVNLALIQSRHLMRIPYQSRYNPVPPMMTSMRY